MAKEMMNVVNTTLRTSGLIVIENPTATPHLCVTIVNIELTKYDSSKHSFMEE